MQPVHGKAWKVEEARFVLRRCVMMKRIPAHCRNLVIFQAISAPKEAQKSDFIEGQIVKSVRRHLEMVQKQEVEHIDHNREKLQRTPGSHKDKTKEFHQSNKTVEIRIQIHRPGSIENEVNHSGY